MPRCAPHPPDRFRARVRHYTPARVAHFNKANRELPLARETERRLMLDLLDLQPGLTIVDAMAGGGYLAEGVAERLGDAATILCVDAAPSFVASIDPRYGRLACALDALALPEAAVDRVANLAGTHHLEYKMDFVHEAHRILKPGGLLAIADVYRDSATARWLNGPVDRFTDIGHDGMFLDHGDLTRMMQDAGFVDVSERYHEYRWRFPDLAALARFCSDLFRMTKASLAEVEAAALRTLDVDVTPGGAAFGWSLIYARGRKAAGEASVRARRSPRRGAGMTRTAS